MEKYHGPPSRTPKRDLLHFTYKQAKKLSSTKYSAVEEILDNMALSMSHQFVGNIRLGLKETLNKELLTYNEKLGGVPLAFDHIKVINPQIIDDNNFFKLELNLSFIVFKPQPGKLLNAVVNKITDDHFGCVVHNCINGSVRQPKRHTLTDEQKDVIDSIEVGDVITFKVWRRDIHHGILFVLGDIIGSCFHKIKKRKSTIIKTTDVSTEEMNSNDKSFCNGDLSANQEFYCSLPGGSFVGQNNRERSLAGELSANHGESISIKTEPSDDYHVASIVMKSPKKKKTIKGNILEREAATPRITLGNETISIKLEPNVENAFDSPLNTPKKKKRKKAKVVENETVAKENILEHEASIERNIFEIIENDASSLKSEPNVENSSDTPINTPTKKKKRKRANVHENVHENVYKNETVSKSNVFENENIKVKSEPNIENICNTPNKAMKKLKDTSTEEDTSQGSDVNITPRKRKTLQGGDVNETPCERKTLQGDDVNETPRKRKRRKKNKVPNGEIITDQSLNENKNILEKNFSIKEEPLSDDDCLTIDESTKKRKRKRKHGTNKC